ncbi:MAG: LysM peptidoglycan-binding domain-containing protein [Steroidobacteraceae bacterium]
MVSNLAFRVRLTAGLALSVTLAACSSLHGFRHTAPAAAQDSSAQSAAPQASDDSQAANDSQTATQAAVSAAEPSPQASPAPVPQVNPNAPLTYTVKRGDTLWGIASMYLRDPWDWPEVWYINPHIRNPHLIYPGDKLALAYDQNGRPHVRVVEESALRLEPRLRSTPITSAIPTIPYGAIAAFLGRPTVLTREQIKAAPHIIAFRDDHQIAGSDVIAYIRGLGSNPHSRYSVIHVSDQLRDPDTGHVLGYLGLYTATALITQPPTRPARATLIDTARETLRGDKLISTDTLAPLNFEPRAPTTQVNGKIAWIVGDTGISDLAGEYDIVVINRGSDDGLEAGTVLEVDQAGQVVRDTYGSRSGVGNMSDLGSVFAPKVRLPDERAGTLLVFKTYPNLSFGLIVGASNTISVGDVVHNP